MDKIGKKLKAREAELAQEELEFEEVSGPESTFDLLSKYRNYLIGGAAVILLIVIGGFVWRYFQGEKNQEASAAAFNAVYNFERGNYGAALQGDSLGALGFSDIVANYGSTDEGNMAKYYEGVSYLNQGNAAMAVESLEAVSKGENMFSVAAYVALASAYEAQGDHSSAADAYEKAAFAVEANKFTTPFGLFHAGLNYEMMGNSDKALEMYQQIKDDYPDSTEGLTIDKYIARLSS
jgi:tetratricopeptide (TPR) repeat protein